uniref:Short-chain dehydrogenase/reductase family 42E member 1 n=1 Tax=Phallusia mammillata TaxID=59560 RepID=A0A6F9DR57_9ASCI|nr:short-chain dehydrogenase/reductase family 42E member 1 [Phallusia mammillata]
MGDIFNAEEIGIPREFTLTTGTNGHSRKLKFLITGGCGYFGFRLARTLHHLGAFVTILDIQLPKTIEKYLDNRLKFMQGDVRDYSAVLKACQDIDCVYHVASFGLSGKDQLDKGLNEAVNVGGTQNIIKACQECGITRLIYTSSYNVVMQGKEICNGTEDLPYGDPEKMVDYYSSTKLRADKLVVKANGSLVAGGSQLSTCCLRPAGIFGPGERRHIDRAAAIVEMNLVFVKIGDAIVDWVHVNNLVQIHLLALPALSSANNSIAAGKCYFVSDNNPVRFFDFLSPLFVGLGHSPPRYKCPYIFVYYAAFLMELVYHLMKPWRVVAPLATRTEVMKMGLSHFHTMDKAIKELGYRPKIYDFADVAKLYLKERPTASVDPIRDTRGNYWAKITLIGLALFCCLLQLLLL